MNDDSTIRNGFVVLRCIISSLFQSKNVTLSGETVPTAEEHTLLTRRFSSKLLMRAVHPPGFGYQPSRQFPISQCPGGLACTLPELRCHCFFGENSYDPPVSDCLKYLYLSYYFNQRLENVVYSYPGWIQVPARESIQVEADCWTLP